MLRGNKSFWKAYNCEALGVLLPADIARSRKSPFLCVKNSDSAAKSGQSSASTPFSFPCFSHFQPFSRNLRGVKGRGKCFRNNGLGIKVGDIIYSIRGWLGFFFFDISFVLFRTDGSFFFAVGDYQPLGASKSVPVAL